MASYWKSQPRKFCEVCKCWIADNRASIEFHERGKSHKAKEEKRISQLRKKSHEQWKNQQKAGQYLKQMEQAARKKYNEDLRAQGYTVKDVVEDEPSGSNVKGQSAPGQKKGQSKKSGGKGGGGGGVQKPDDENVPAAKNKPKSIRVLQGKCLWTKQTDAMGNVYYWNMETAESQWEEPRGYFESPLEMASNAAHDILNKPKDEEEQTESPWSEEVSPEGHTYYWNSETGESRWVKPEGYNPKKADSSEPDGGEAAKRPRMDPYGGWTVVKAPQPVKRIDLQLPEKPANPAAEGVIDRNALEHSDVVPEKPKFKEKIINSLGDDSEGSTVFKKKAPGKQRSIRKRTADD